MVDSSMALKRIVQGPFTPEVRLVLALAVFDALAPALAGARMHVR